MNKSNETDTISIAELLETIIWNIGEVRLSAQLDIKWSVEHPSEYYDGQIDALVELGKDITSRQVFDTKKPK